MLCCNVLCAATVVADGLLTREPWPLQVDKHCMQCRACWVLTCVDCSKDFAGEEFRAHTSCMSEAEKYQGKLYNDGGKVRVVARRGVRCYSKR